MLVIDASALADLVLDLPRGEHVRGHLAERGPELHAPHLLDVEVMSSLRRAVAAKRVSPPRATAALTDLLAMSIARYPHAMLAARIWELRANFTPYDAVYLALAEHLDEEGLPLLTADARFARATRKHTGVEVLLAA
jgi:predicted nucleic acid-binding protein